MRVIPLHFAVTVALIALLTVSFLAVHEQAPKTLYVRCGETEFRDVVMVHPDGDGIVMRMRDGRSVFYTGAELCEWGEAVERGP